MLLFKIVNADIDNNDDNLEKIINDINSDYLIMFDGNTTASANLIGKIREHLSEDLNEQIWEMLLQYENEYYLFIFDSAKFNSETIKNDLTQSLNQLRQLKAWMINIAKRRGVIKYPDLYDFFGDIKKSTVWSMFEVACERLVSSKIAIYGALLADNNGVPESGFYDIFINNKQVRNYDINTNPLDLSIEQKRAITDFERERVYNHAKNI